MNLEGSVVLYKFSKVIVTDSTLEPKRSPAIWSWPDLPHQVHIPSCGAGFKAKEKVVHYPCHIPVTIAPALMSHQISCDCSLQGSQMHKTVDNFPQFPT